MNTTDQNFPQFVESLGGLHDAGLTGLSWHPNEKRLEIEIDDLHANFNGLPEYQGPAKAKFIFAEVTGFEAEINLTESGLTMYDWTFENADGIKFACEISFSPGGRLKIECEHIECKKLGE